MSLSLDCGTEPKGLEVRTLFDDKVYLGEYEITFEDFFAMVLYVFRNSDLKENDIRLKYLTIFNHLHKVPGWNRHGIPSDPKCMRLDVKI